MFLYLVVGAVSVVNFFLHYLPCVYTGQALQRNTHPESKVSKLFNFSKINAV